MIGKNFVATAYLSSLSLGGVKADTKPLQPREQKKFATIKHPHELGGTSPWIRKAIGPMVADKRLHNSAGREGIDDIWVTFFELKRKILKEVRKP